MARNKAGCLEIIDKLDELDVKSWLLTAKICSDEEDDFEDFEWFKKGKLSFKEKDWPAEVENFRLNNDSATKALIEFAQSEFK